MTNKTNLESVPLTIGEASPAGREVEVLAWLLTDGNEAPIDSTVRWDVAKHWPEYAMPLVDRAHVTRLQAEVERLRLNQFAWLWTHCRAIGMTEKSQSGTMEHDICHFTITLQSENAALQQELTKAQEEVQRYKTMSDNYCSLGMDANIELAKTRELLKMFYGEPTMCAFKSAVIEQFLSSQAAPAAKDGE